MGMVAFFKPAVVFLVSVVALTQSSPSPLRLKRAPQEGTAATGNRFFTGNSVVDAGAAGAALGAAAQFFGNQIFNPCRGGNRVGNRGGNRGGNTGNRILGGETIQNGALGFLAGFAGSSLINNTLGNPCGK